MTLTEQKQNRRGAALIEMAFVVVIFLMLLFGIMEYCRFLFVRQLIVNAAQNSARYGVVNTTDTTVESDTKARATQLMAGMDGKVKSFTVQVYKADAAGNKVGTAAEAAFGEYLAVQINCDYDPILPSFLFMKNTMPLQTKALMYSEAN
jgi:Flp pilus assembly protein TadG